MRNSALGLVEVRGYLGAVAVADAALKAASVTCIGVEIIQGGLVTVKLDGDVGAVQAAVEAGAELAKQLDVLVTRHVIARMHEETAAMVATPDTPDDEGDNHCKELESDSTSQNEQGEAELVSEIATEHEAITESKEAAAAEDLLAATSINEGDEKDSGIVKDDASEQVAKLSQPESVVRSSIANAESTAAKASNSTVESKEKAGITKTAQAAVTASNTTSTVDNKQKQAGTGNGGAARVKPVPSPAAKRSKSTKKASS